MGKIRTRFIGIEEIEKQQKEEQKKRSQEKKVEKVSDDVILDSESAPEVGTKEAGQTGKTKKTKGSRIKTGKTKTRGKKYKDALKKIDEKKAYDLTEAVETLKKIAFAKFEESVELHINLMTDGLRGEVELPHTTGRSLRIAIVDDKVLEDISEGNINFDILISHPSFMPKLAKFARTLGPKGLMPNPKAGTVSTNPEETAKQFEKGMLRWKSESKFPIVHQLIAKLPHDTKAIVENAEAFLQSVGKKNMKDVYIKSTMSPSLKLNLDSIQ